MKKKLAHLMFASLLLGAMSCSDDPKVATDEPQQPTPQPPVEESLIDLTEAETSALVQSANHFGYFIVMMDDEVTDANASVGRSTLSNSLLGQLVACSKEDIAREIAEMDFHPTENQSELESGFAKLIENMDQIDNDVDCHFSSSLWYSHIDNVLPNEDFMDEIEAKYFTFVRPVKVNESRSMTELINNWAKRATKDKYADFVPQTDEFQPDALLATVLYLKGAWAEKFDSETDGEFQGITKSTAVKMLNKKARMQYKHDKAGQWIKMGLGSDNHFELKLCLPDTDPSQAHSYCDWNNKYVNLSFPCFVFNPNKNSKVTKSFYTSLRTLSGKTKWDAEKETFIKGEFGAYCPVYSQPVEKTLDFYSGICVEFCNKVAEGAEHKPLSPDTPEAIIKQMNFNHPFSFVITEKTTGIILVEGDVKNIE